MLGNRRGFDELERNVKSLYVKGKDNYIVISLKVTQYLDLTREQDGVLGYSSKQNK